MRTRYIIVAAIAVMMTACEIYKGDEPQPASTGEIITHTVYRDFDEKCVLINNILLLDAYINETDDTEREAIAERMTNVDAIIVGEESEDVYILRDYGSYDNSPSDYYRDIVVDTNGTTINNTDSEWHITNGGKLYRLPMEMTIKNGDNGLVVDFTEKNSKEEDAEVINEAELTITTDGIINGTIYQSDVRIYFNTEVEDVRYVEGEGLTSGVLAIKCHDSYYNTDDEVRAELFIRDGHQMATVYFLDYVTEQRLTRNYY